MPTTTANGITIAYETHGSDDDPVVLMIMGLGAQLAMWSDNMINTIVEAGYRVITFDNRDIGLSEKMTDKKPPNLIAQILAKRVGISLKAPYSLLDMADDTLAFMDSIGIEKAHIVGVSMGGMIAQITSGKAPRRAASLTAIMTTTGNPKLPRPKREILGAINRKGPPPTTRDEAISASVGAFSIIGTPGEDHNTNGYRDRIAKSYDRCYHPAGLRRQMSGIVAAGDFRTYTRRVSAPTLVIHGALDPLVPVEGGRDVHKNIPHSKLEIIDDMGHDIPPRHSPHITQMMIEHFRAADAGA